jgi:DUF438 domain-containing protein
MAEALDNAAARAAAFNGLLSALLAGGSTKDSLERYRAYIDDARPEDLVAAVDAAVARDEGFEALKPAVSKLINLIYASLSRRRYLPGGNAFLDSLIAENAGLSALLARGKALIQALNGKAGPDAAEPVASPVAAGPGASATAMPPEAGPVAAATVAAPASGAAALDALEAWLAELGAVEIHYRKKENVLFPWFEARYPEYRCVRLMWDIQDDARRGLKELASWLAKARANAVLDLASFNAIAGRLYFDLNANITREECALFPVMAILMDGQAAAGLLAESRDYGWAFLDAEAAARYARVASAPAGAAPDTTVDAANNSAAARESAAALASPSAANAARPAPGSDAGEATRSVAAVAQSADEPGLSAGAGFSGRTGALPPEVLGALFSALPVDMTYVDAEDRVRWFSDSPHRIFPRSPAIIGRDVRNCHPGASVGRVLAILEAFKSGAKDKESFWISMGGRFISIEYFALRAPDGRYLGTLEASQDLSEKRALTGEKRLAT